MPGWRENCEVFLVAIVVAVAVRTFFLQPFTIPTGSMQPTLNGIIGHQTEAPSPGLLQQVVDFVLRGRNYFDVAAKSDDIILRLGERKMLYFFTFTDVECAHSYLHHLGAGRYPAELLQRAARARDACRGNASRAGMWMPATTCLWTR